MNGELARVRKTHGWEGEVLRTLVSPDLTLLTLQTLWHTQMVPWLLCISTCYEYSQKVFSVGPGFSAFTHCLHLRHWFMPLNDTWGKTSIFCSVDFSQNDSFLIHFLPNTCFCNQRKDANIYCMFPPGFYS